MPEVEFQLDLGVIQSTLPLRLESINFENKNRSVRVNEVIASKLEETFNDYIKAIGFTDSANYATNLYLNTIQLEDSLLTIYVMLLKNYPTGEVNSKILFYDNQKKSFIGEALDFKLYALYELADGKLRSTQLKIDFKITFSEIESLDFNKDGKTDYKFKRLWHNGTFNALHTTIVTVKKNTLDTLYFCEEGLGELAEKKNCL